MIPLIFRLNQLHIVNSEAKYINRGSGYAELLRLCNLGFGSFGTVSLVRDLQTGQLLALKMMIEDHHSQNLCKQKQLSRVQALQNELTILQRLSSPRVIKLLGWGYYGSSTAPILLLEYIDGGSLHDLVAATSDGGGGLPELAVRRFSQQILEGLVYLHARGVVHGDIKCRNILVSSTDPAPDGECGLKIADFGAAGSAGVTRGGTPLWMAPELLRESVGGTPADIWSFGCTVLEMLLGSPPLDHLMQSCGTVGFDSDPMAVLLRIAVDMDESPPLPAAGLSPLARDFLIKCLRKNPAARWTADQLLDHPFIKDRSFHTREPGLETCHACIISSHHLSPRSTLDHKLSQSSLSSSQSSEIPILNNDGNNVDYNLRCMCRNNSEPSSFQNDDDDHSLTTSRSRAKANQDLHYSESHSKAKANRDLHYSMSHSRTKANQDLHYSMSHCRARATQDLHYSVSHKADEDLHYTKSKSKATANHHLHCSKPQLITNNFDDTMWLTVRCFENLGNHTHHHRPFMLLDDHCIPLKKFCEVSFESACFLLQRDCHE